jgi:hypothetical protein
MYTSGDLSKLTAAQRTVVLAKPWSRIRQFASLLGWRGLSLDWVRFTDEGDARRPAEPEPRIVVYYVTTDAEFHIQINESPIGPCRYYEASVGAFRYGIAQIAWHPFELFDEDALFFAEAKRLRPLLDRQQFRDPLRRAAFKKAHPELLLSPRQRRWP